MMVLMTLQTQNWLVGILCVSLALLVLLIAYKKLLRYLGKGVPPKEDYCVLYSLEHEVASGEVQFYFTCESPKEIVMELLKEDMTVVSELANKSVEAGGHIVRFDTTLLVNGMYYYRLRTDNQKTMKRMQVANN
jgi:hypothetical protein